MRFWLILSFLLLFISCLQDIKQPNGNAPILAKYHKKILSTTPDSILYYLNKCDKLITENLPDSILAENSYLKGYYFNKIKNQPDSSYKYYNKAISFSKEKIRYKRELNYFLNLAETYLNNDKNANALATINTFETLVKNSKNNSKNLEYIYDFKEKYYAKFNNTTKQLAYNKRLATLYKKSKDSINIFLNVIDRANIYLKNNAYKQANHLLDSLAKSAQKPSNPYAIYRFNLKQGDYAYHNKKQVQSLDYYKNALRYLKKDKYYQNAQVFNEVKQLYINIFETAITLKKYSIAKKYQDTIASFQLNNSLKKDFLFHKMTLNYLSKKNSTTWKQELAAFYDFLNTMEVKRINNKLYKLEKLKTSEQELIIANQQAALKNQRLKKRQYLLLFISLFFGTGIFYLYILYKQRKEISTKNELLLEQRLLSAQMNPHFASNVLFSIHSFIKTEPNKAENYLLLFSRLLRQNLESSLKNYIAIHTEVALLKNYLDLQLIRFPNKFTYHIALENSFEDAGICIPPMLVQPFVENALIHGILPLETAGEIHLQFIQKKEYILCTIQDNGKGFRLKQAEKKVSSTQLIEKLLRKTISNPVSVRSNSKETKGTIVYLKIPYQINFNLNL